MPGSCTPAMLRSTQSPWIVIGAAGVRRFDVARRGTGGRPLLTDVPSQLDLPTRRVRERVPQGLRLGTGRDEEGVRPDGTELRSDGHGDQHVGDRRCHVGGEGADPCLVAGVATSQLEGPTELEAELLGDLVGDEDLPDGSLGPDARAGSALASRASGG
jgi:hypothetical protein